MGANATKEQLSAKLDELEKQEYNVNLQLKALQMQLNNIVPDEEKIKVNEELSEEPEKIENIKKQNAQYLEECSSHPKKFRKYDSDDEGESVEEEENEEEEEDEEKKDDLEEVNEGDEEEGNNIKNESYLIEG